MVLKQTIVRQVADRLHVDTPDGCAGLGRADSMAHAEALYADGLLNEQVDEARDRWRTRAKRAEARCEQLRKELDDAREGAIQATRKAEMRENFSANEKPGTISIPAKDLTEAHVGCQVDWSPAAYPEDFGTRVPGSLEAMSPRTLIILEAFSKTPSTDAFPDGGVLLGARRGPLYAIPGDWEVQVTLEAGQARRAALEAVLAAWNSFPKGHDHAERMFPGIAAAMETAARILET